jgi:hypothetical protein
MTVRHRFLIVYLWLLVRIKYLIWLSVIVTDQQLVDWSVCGADPVEVAPEMIPAALVYRGEAGRVWGDLIQDVVLCLIVPDRDLSLIFPRSQQNQITDLLHRASLK